MARSPTAPVRMEAWKSGQSRASRSLQSEGNFWEATQTPRCCRWLRAHKKETLGRSFSKRSLGFPSKRRQRQRAGHCPGGLGRGSDTVGLWWVWPTELRPTVGVHRAVTMGSELTTLGVGNRRRVAPRSWGKVQVCPAFLPGQRHRLI